MLEGLAQPMHLAVIVFIALLFFGPSKLGDLGKGLGDGIRNFKNGLKDDNPKPQEPQAAITSTSEEPKP
jgi:sec-independent protein translocase protein TatA